MRTVAVLAMIAGVLVCAEGSGGGGCDGGAGIGCGFGGDVGFQDNYGLPRVEVEVEAGPVSLKVDRTKWGYSVAGTGASPLAIFRSDTVRVELFDSPTNAAARRTATASRAVVYERRIRTDRGLTATKTAYGSRRAIHAISYTFDLPNGRTLLVRALPTSPQPDWNELRRLVQGQFGPAKPKAVKR